MLYLQHGKKEKFVLFDSHVHYSLSKYDGEFSCIAREGDGYAAVRTDRDQLFAAMRKSGVCGFIEPSISPDNIERQLTLTEKYGGFGAVGVHPKEAIKARRGIRKKLWMYAKHPRIVAIGEAGLDYHLPGLVAVKRSQKWWFVYQIKLAHKRNLPLILHIRSADDEALKILKKHRKKLHGGVVHCFSGNPATAQAYIELGFALGIGGMLLTAGERGETLRNAVREVPLSSLLVETDAPYVLPDTGSLTCSRNQRKKLLNSSLILPEVVREIARIKELSADATEQVIYQNTVRVFGLTTQSESI